MADILAALDALDKEEKAKNPTNTKRRRPQSRSSRRGSTGRPQSLPSPRERQARTHLTAPDSAKSDYAPSVRSESQGGGRRISFADPPRPSPASKRIWIATEKASLASGFPYDPRLQKYIGEDIWDRFNREIIYEANVPGKQWMWRLHRKEVIANIKNDLQYNGDFKKKFKSWSKVFKTAGFTIDLALPGEQLEDDPGEDGEDRNRDVKKESKKFRLIVTPNTEKGTSVYSRTSSLTRSITGEGANLSQLAASQEAANQAAATLASQNHHQDSDEQGDP